MKRAAKRRPPRAWRYVSTAGRRPKQPLGVAELLAWLAAVAVAGAFLLLLAQWALALAAAAFVVFGALAWRELARRL